jgi:O-Antigen ligase
MDMQRKSHFWLIIALFLIAAAAQAFLVVQSAYIAIILSAAVLFFLLFHNAPVGLLMIMIFIFPFSGTEAFQTAAADIPGFKPLELLAASVLIVALLNIRSAVRPPRTAAVFFGTIILVFTVAFLRSLPHLHSINQLLPESLSVRRYFLSEYFKPLIYFIPAIIISQYVYTTKDIERVVQTINWSITALSLVIIGFFFFNPHLILDPSSTRRFYASSFGLHTNSIANYYIIGFPFVLTDLFRGKLLTGAVKILICAAGIVPLFSRSAYFLFIASFFIYLFISGRRKWLPLLMAAMVAFYFIIPSIVTQRATRGFHTGNRNLIMAGRVDYIWLPLLKEITSNPRTLLLGNGRFAMVSTNAHKEGIILQAMHPHNMYLEMVLDSGLIGLAIILSLFALLLKKAYLGLKMSKKSPFNEYQVAVMTSLVCFLISGLTDRTFFPDEINGYLWIITAMAFVLFRYFETSEQRSYREVQKDTIDLPYESHPYYR